MRFVHKVSKGSRFNQVYIPKKMEEIFKVGDLVEVRLLKKKAQLHYSKNLYKLSEFKEKLIREIFSFLGGFKGIEQIFIVGSFLTQKVDYNDVDIVLMVDKKSENIENEIYNKLVDKFNIKFHIISVSGDRLDTLMKICPLTRSMFYYYVSDKEFKIFAERKINKNHIKFLLMMPEDILEINVNSRVFYDNIRRLITIERFLENKGEDPKKIDNELNRELGNLFFQIKNDRILDKENMERLRKIIRLKLNKIKKMV